MKVDRTKSSDLWKPFVHGQKYELGEDVFLMRLKGKRNDLALVPSSQSRLTASNCYESSGYYSAPESIAAYQASAHSTNWTDVAGIARTGTLLEPCRLDRFYQFSLWHGFQRATARYATLLSGEFNGTLVNIEDLHWNPDKYLKEK